jgi:hypothetical protein
MRAEPATQETHHEVHEGHEEVIDSTKKFVLFVFFVVNQLVLLRLSLTLSPTLGRIRLSPIAYE